MKLKVRTINQLAKIICGNDLPTLYRSGPKLVSLFVNYGFDDTYGQGFPSRNTYTEERLLSLNGKPELKQIIEEVLSPVNFLDENTDHKKIIELLNKFLRFDGYEVIAREKDVQVLDLSGAVVEFGVEEHEISELTLEFIKKHIEKCSKKLSENDFDGAITNARSLVETVLIDIDKRFDSNCPEYDGDLIKLYRRTQVHLNLTPGNDKLDQTLKQILSGLNSIVNGLAGMRNKMSDAHAVSYKPEKHHALLAINSSKTLCEFILDTLEYQSRKR